MVGGEGEIARQTERHLPRPTDSNRRLLTVRASRSFPRCISLRPLLTYVSQPHLGFCEVLTSHGLFFRVLSWSGSLLQYRVSLSSSDSPRRPAVHHCLIPSLALKPHPLPPCISTHRSQRSFSQCFSPRMALNNTAFLLLVYIPDVNTAVSVQDHAIHGRS